LASCGANVLLVSRDRAAGEKAADELCDAGGRAAFHSGDVTDVASMRTAAEKAVERYGSLPLFSLEKFEIAKQSGQVRGTGAAIDSGA
jgi:NAD(P)-dependent dehydrogenase (short-subunit alcohol dehydrogenase family)